MRREKEKIPYALYNCPLRFNPFQYEPFWLWNKQDDKKRMYIADEVGLGKTIEVGIIIKEELMRKENCGKFLIVAPRFLCEQWKEQLYELFNIKSIIYPSKKKNEDMYDVIVLPISRLKDFKYNKEEMLKCVSTIIVDEAHYFRNGSDTARYENLREIIDQISNRVFMSATPINNYSTDWENQIKLLSPNSNSEDFNNLTHSKKSEAFPYCKIREINTIYCSLTYEEKEFYNTTEDTEFGKTIFRHIGASSLYALDCCYKNNGFDELEWGMIKESFSEDLNCDLKEIGEIETDKKTPDKKTPDKDSKAEKLYDILNKKMLNEETNNKAVIFAHYLATCEYLVEYLAGKDEFYIDSNRSSCNEKIRIFSIKGKMSQIEQQRVAKQFKEYPGKAILICSDVCKEGVNLQCANILINYDLPFNPAIMEQRIGRVDRVGQSKDIYIYNFVVEDTYDITVYYQFILGKLDTIRYFSEKLGLNELKITSEDSKDDEDKIIGDSINKAYEFAKNYKRNVNDGDIDSENKKLSELKEYLTTYLLSAKSLKLQGVEEKQRYLCEKKNLEDKEIIDNIEWWITEVIKIKKIMKTEENIDSFNDKLAWFNETYGEPDSRDYEITISKDQIIKLFQIGENRRWLKGFLNLDEENGGFDVYKYLENTQDIDGAKEKLVVKESPVTISYDYLDPEINKTGMCDKDWDEYLEQFVPYEIKDLIENQQINSNC